MVEMFEDPADYYKSVRATKGLDESYKQLKKKHTWKEASVLMNTTNAHFFSGGTLYCMEDGILRCYDGDWEESALSDRERAEQDWYEAKQKKLNRKETND